MTRSPAHFVAPQAVRRSFGRLAALLASATLLLGTTATPAWAWGRMGHRVSAMIAESRLTPATKAAIRDLLGPDETLVSASTWADEVRRDYKDSGPWHYVNVPITETGYNAKFCPKETGCVVSKITEFRALLADPKAPREERKKAFKFFVHFLQDMHQPVHVGDRSDRGGNDCQVQFFGQGSNLHRVWDSGLLEHAYAKEDDLRRDVDAFLSDKYAPGWADGTVEDWANESFLAARDAYTVPGTGAALKKGAKLDQDYQDANLPVARKRVTLSAVRLAAVLNAIFDPPAPANK